MTFLQLILLYFSALVGSYKYHPGTRSSVRRIKKNRQSEGAESLAGNLTQPY